MKEENNLNRYTESTPLLNFEEEKIRSLVSERGWGKLPAKEKVNQIYLFVRDEIAFGYNEKDEIPASQVLSDGIGQCNTKATLLMALFRAVGIPCRFHGFTIDKALQKGAITGIWYLLAPRNIVHSWVEVQFNDRWYNLEGVILDKNYLSELQKTYSATSENFCGFGAYTEDLQSPDVDWNERDTYIQKLGINNDFGLFDNPDAFYPKYGQHLPLIKKIMFRLFVRKHMNKNVRRIRNLR